MVRGHPVVARAASDRDDDLGRRPAFDAPHAASGALLGFIPKKIRLSHVEEGTILGSGKPRARTSSVRGIPLDLIAEAEIHDALNQDWILDALGQRTLGEVFGALQIGVRVGLEHVDFAVRR